MRTNFLKLFQVEILHSYFESSICPCLQFLPAASTQGLMERYKFTILQNVNGFQFYSTSAVSLRDSLDYIRTVAGTNYFEFELFNNDAAFYCFTGGLPLNWQGQLLYNSAMVNNDNGIFVMTQSLSVPEITAITGKLKINFDDLLKYDAAAQPLTYRISYTARATQWQYYIVNRNAIPMENPAVKGKSGIVFDNAGSVTMDTGEKALLFYSGTLLPLSKVPNHKFDLVNTPADNNSATIKTKQNSARIIFKSLPTPDPMRMGTVAIDNKTQVSSPIYIYV